MKLALKMTPQRSTQYANMVETLAAPELLASPLGAAIKDIVPVRLAGQRYLLATFDDERMGSTYSSTLTGHPQEVFLRIIPVLSRLGATSEVYEYFEELADVRG